MPICAARCEVGCAERVERDRQAARRRAGQRGQRCWSRPRARPAGRRRSRAPRRAPRAKAGSAATTAPNPTRLATLITGSAEALTPASMVARRSGMRRTLSASTVRMAQVSAVDDRPDAGDRGRRRPAPLAASPGSSRSSRGRTISDRTRLTRMTTTIGAAAAANDGWPRRRVPVRDFGRIEFARGRRAFAQRLVVGERLGRLRRAVAEAFALGRCAAASSRCSHHRPKPSMISEARTPRPGAANGVVPKKGIGMVFWIDGVPGIADMVKVDVPSMIAAGIRRRGMPADAEQVLRHRRDDEEGDEQADAAIGDDRAAEHDREDGALRAELLGHEIGDRRDRAASPPSACRTARRAGRAGRTGRGIPPRCA